MESKPNEMDYLAVDAATFPNAVLQRLISEVQVAKQNDVNAYNRLHNRHNRTKPGTWYPRPEPKPTEPDGNQ